MANWENSCTYILCGFYVDYGYFKEGNEVKRSEIHKELKNRWDNNIDKDEFQEYFDNWGLGPENFCLDKDVLEITDELDKKLQEAVGLPPTLLGKKEPKAEKTATQTQTAFDFFFGDKS